MSLLAEVLSHYCILVEVHGCVKQVNYPQFICLFDNLFPSWLVVYVNSPCKGSENDIPPCLCILSVSSLLTWKSFETVLLSVSQAIFAISLSVCLLSLLKHTGSHSPFHPFSLVWVEGWAR